LKLTRALVAGTVALVAMSAALAQSRPDSRTMSCQQATKTVTRAGSVVMITGPGTYERVVASERFCLVGESALLALAATRDAPHCVVGYYCGQSTRWTLD
jgi:hypothetical protein